MLANAILTHLILCNGGRSDILNATGISASSLVETLYRAQHLDITSRGRDEVDHNSSAGIVWRNSRRNTEVEGEKHSTTGIRKLTDGHILLQPLVDLTGGQCEQSSVNQIPLTVVDDQRNLWHIRGLDDHVVYNE